jgi:hypothetical protein
MVMLLFIIVKWQLGIWICSCAQRATENIYHFVSKQLRITKIAVTILTGGIGMIQVDKIIKALTKVIMVIAVSMGPMAYAQQPNPGKLPNCPENQSGRYHNCFGTSKTPGGDFYIGEFKDGKMHGRGTYTFNDGAEYSGEFSNGMFNGRGSFSFPRGTNAGYIGQWLNGKPHGEGIEFFSDGRQPNQGAFENGQFVSSKKRSISTPESPYDDPQWKRLIQHDRKTEYSRWVYVNPKYQMRHDSVSTIWQLVSFDQAQSLNGATAYGSQLELWEYDCQMKMQRLKAFIRFNNTMGSGLITDELYFEDDGWEKIEKWKLKELGHACK